MLQCLIRALDFSSSIESKLELPQPEKEASETEPWSWSRCCGINGPRTCQPLLDTNKFIHGQGQTTMWAQMTFVSAINILSLPQRPAEYATIYLQGYIQHWVQHWEIFPLPYCAGQGFPNPCAALEQSGILTAADTAREGKLKREMKRERGGKKEKGKRKIKYFLGPGKEEGYCRW